MAEKPEIIQLNPSEELTFMGKVTECASTELYC